MGLNSKPPLMPTPARPGAPASAVVFPSSLRAMALAVVSFEALVVLYMFAGLFKEDPRMAWIPFDPTGLFFALSVGVGVLILVLKPLVKSGLYPVFAGLGLVVWFAFSLLWSPSQTYGPEKVFSLATLALWGLIAGAMIIAPDRARLRRLFLVLVLASVVAALEAIVVYLESGGGRLYIGSSSYLGLGRLCGLGAGIVFVAWLSSRRRFGTAGLICLGLFALFGFVLLIGGGRGPLLATAGSLVVPLLVGVQSSRGGLRVARYMAPAIGLGLLAVGALTVWVQSSDRRPETFQRLESIIVEKELGNSAQNRAQYYLLTPAVWGTAPILGHGAGSWKPVTNMPDRYPHNLFAETVVESGLIGLVLVLALLITALRPVSFARVRSDPLAMCALMLFVNTFLNAMVSGDLAGNRVLFLMIGTLTVFALPQSEVRPRWVVAASPRQPTAAALAGAPSRRA